MKSPLDKAHNITSPFGKRTLNGKPDMHNGVDLVPADGRHPTAILSPVDGTIADMAANIPDSHTGLNVTTNVKGNFIWLQTAAGYIVKFHHLRADSIPGNYVKGTKVKAGQLIGVMGTTGQSSGVHLHYEFRDPLNNAFDPNPYINNNAIFPNTTVSSGSGASTNAGFTPGVSKVRVNPGAKDYNGGGLSSAVYANVYDLIQLSNDRAVIGIGKAITAAVRVIDLVKV